MHFASRNISRSGGDRRVFGAPFIRSTSGRADVCICTLHGPDGADYENEYVVEEFVEPERIVISHPDPAHYFQLFITLAAEGEQTDVGGQLSEVTTKAKEKTRLSWRQRFDTREHFARVKSFVAEANEQNLDRLEAPLKKMQPK